MEPGNQRDLELLVCHSLFARFSQASRNGFPEDTLGDLKKDLARSAKRAESKESAVFQLIIPVPRHFLQSPTPLHFVHIWRRNAYKGKPQDKLASYFAVRFHYMARRLI